MELHLQGKRALITGSSRGIGEAIAKRLSLEGASVVIHGRNKVELARVAQEIQAQGGKVAISQGDLCFDDQVAQIADTALSAFGGIDILINNAGAYHLSDWEEADPASWLELFNTNVVSMVRIIHALLPHMKLNGWGRIIQTGSVAGSHPRAGSPDYAVTKAANINMTVSLAKALAETGITVNTVSPGPILTPGVEEMFREVSKERKWATDDMKKIEKRAAKEFFPTLVGRYGTPDEVAALVTFLASPLANFITGSDFRIDGGRAGSIN